jgi:phospholipid-binding lipoprotein MlaA
MKGATTAGCRIGTLMVILAISLLAGCATTQGESGSQSNDPFEKMNRSIHTFNLETDRIFLKPIAKGYERFIPGPVRKGVNNFFSNLWEPMTIVNDLLQGKFGYAAKDTTRFLVNSTVGILGIFDVASRVDLGRRKEDFGQTLAVWGIPPGPYLVLPFLGPSSIRDTTGLVPQFFYGDALLYIDSPEVWYAAGTRLVDTRSRLLGTDDILDLQPDTYLFLREAYRQQRINQIHDGNPPGADLEETEDALIDQLLDQ